MYIVIRYIHSWVTLLLKRQSAIPKIKEKKSNDILQLMEGRWMMKDTQKNIKI